MQGEVVLVPCYKRNEFLYSCLSRIRRIEPEIPILVFPDRGTWKDRLLLEICRQFNARVIHVPVHNFYGNSYNVMEAYRFAYNGGASRVYMIEDDVMVHADFFKWHRRMHEENPDRIFAAMGWIFNHYAPIEEMELYQPWLYSIGLSFERKKLRKIVEHATPLYYEDMTGYLLKNFKDNALNASFGIAHYEQDGLLQRILNDDHTQVICPGIAKCSHLGAYGYNAGWEQQWEFFAKCKTFQERVQRLEEFIADEHWRAEVFGREIVEREVGHEIPKRIVKYEVKFGPWSTEFSTELSRSAVPRKIRNVHLPPEAEFSVLSP